MNIAYVSDTYYPSVNGIVTSLSNSKRVLEKKGYKIIVLTSKFGNNEKNDIKVFRSANIFNYPDIKIAFPKKKEVFKVLNEFNPDVIHINMPSLLSLRAIQYAKKKKIRVIGTYHTLLPDFLGHIPIPMIFSNMRFMKKLTWRLSRWIYNKCDYVTTPSEIMKKRLEEKKIKNVHAISNGVDTNKFKKLKEGKKNRIIHVGRISYEKNVEVVLKAFDFVNAKIPDSELVIVGSGPDIEKMKNIAKNMISGNNIKFLGLVDHDELPEIYNSGSVFTTASTIETEGLVVLEAMACGLPIVGVDAMAVPSLVKENGFIVKPGDAREMGNKIIEALGNKKMGEKSLKKAQEYSLDKSVDKMMKLYS